MTKCKTKSSEGLFAAQRRVRLTDPSTSYIAAEEKVVSGSIESEHRQILDVLSRKADYDDNNPGLTCAEICGEIAGMKWRSIYIAIARRMGEIVWLNRDKTVHGPVEVVCKRISCVGGMRSQSYRLRKG